MANQEQLDRLKQSVRHWNKWREQHPETRPDLNNADLSHTDLSFANLGYASLYSADLSFADLNHAFLYYAYLEHANLSGANLYFAQMDNANFRYANLSGAKLDYAQVSYTSLVDADLSGADLSHASLTYATLDNTNLSGTNLQGTLLHGTVFARLDLRPVKGLTGIAHRGPSQVELHSVQLPQNGSASHFLRGVGVPDEWIDFWRSTLILPIQYHSCFISYSSKDEDLARRLHADLQDHGVRCWFAPKDLKIGDKFRDRIDRAIHLQDKLLLLLSQHSIASDWVADEVEAAIEKEQRQKREMLFPVRLDASVMRTTKAWAAKLRRTRHIGNFSDWTDPQAYQQAFERLLRDLKQEAGL